MHTAGAYIKKVMILDQHIWYDVFVGGPDSTVLVPKSSSTGGRTPRSTRCLLVALYLDTNLIVPNGRCIDWSIWSDLHILGLGLNVGVGAIILIFNSMIVKGTSIYI